MAANLDIRKVRPINPYICSDVDLPELQFFAGGAKPAAEYGITLHPRNIACRAFEPSWRYQYLRLTPKVDGGNIRA